MMKIGDKAKVVIKWSVFRGEIVTLIEITDTRCIFTNDKHKCGRLIVGKDSVNSYVEWERVDDGV